MTNLNLTQKEKMLLQDQKSHEEVCIEKYNNYANQAQDPQLRQLFKTYESQEQQHLNTINQILNGQVPQMNQGQQQAQPMNNANQSSQMGVQGRSNSAGMVNQNDTALCNDVLMTEKYVSGTYNTAIFEFTDSNVRQALNHIQKEEQQHGEGVFNYMRDNGMYNPQ